MEFTEFVIIVCCIFVPLFWFFFVYEEGHGPLGQSDIPGDLGTYFIGEGREFFQNPLDFAYSRFAKHGNIFKTKILGCGVVFVSGSRGLELFSSGPEKGLGASPEAFLHDLPAHSFNLTSHKRSVLMSESEFQHGFKHLAILASVTSLCNREEFFNECMHVIEMSMTAQAVLDEPFSGAKLCKDIFLHISVTVLMKETIHKSKLKELLEKWLAMQSTFPLSCLHLNRIWEAGRTAITELDDLLSEEVKSRLGTNREFGDDLIGCMLETAMRRSDGFGKTLQDIIEKTVLTECWTVVYGLSVHVACACTWLLVCLERFPNVKEAAITEVRNCPNSLQFGTLRTKGALPYLDATIDEALRMYGFLGNPNMKRVALFDISFENYTIPKGTPVLFPLNSPNFKDENFEDASLFKPERHLKGPRSSDDRSSFSFGVGHHTCPGDNMSRNMLKMVAATLLTQFDSFADPLQSFKPVYPRGKATRNNFPELGTETFYFPVPEDMMRYERFNPRKLSFSSPRQYEDVNVSSDLSCDNLPDT
jgi:cytochrome P450